MKEKVIAPRSPWQNPCAERLIGTLRREGLDNIIVFNERHLARVLQEYLDYYHRYRPHRALDRAAPIPRVVEAVGEAEVIGNAHGRWVAPSIHAARGVTCRGWGGSGITTAGVGEFDGAERCPSAWAGSVSRSGYRATLNRPKRTPPPAAKLCAQAPNGTSFWRGTVDPATPVAKVVPSVTS